MGAASASLRCAGLRSATAAHGSNCNGESGAKEPQKRGETDKPQRGGRLAAVSGVSAAAGFAVAEPAAGNLSSRWVAASSWTDSASGVSAPSFSLRLS
jgi:hypothetical protein